MSQKHFRACAILRGSPDCTCHRIQEARDQMAAQTKQDQPKKSAVILEFRK
jgi:hypothetical protein